MQLFSALRKTFFEMLRPKDFFTTFAVYYQPNITLYI